MKKAGSVLMAVLTSITVIASACTGSPAPAATQPPAAPTTAAAQPAATAPSAAAPTAAAAAGPAKEVLLGLSTDLTGTIAGTGISTDRGTKMAIKEINDAGGFTVAGQKYTFKLITEDNKYTSEGGVATATKLVTKDKVKFLMVLGSPGLAVLSVTEPAKVIMLASMSSDDILRGKKYSVRLYPISAFSYIVQGKWFQENRPQVKKVYIIQKDDPTGQVAIQYAKTILPTFGMEVLGTDTYPATATDLHPLLARILPTNPDLIDTGPDKAAALGGKQALEQGYNGLFASGTAGTRAQWVSLVGKQALGDGRLYGIEAGETGTDADATPPRIREYFANYKKTYGEDWVSPSDVYYQYVYLLEQAMMKAGTVDDTDAIMKAIETSEFDLPWGKVAFGGQDIWGVPHQGFYRTFLSEYQGSKDQFVTRAYLDGPDLASYYSKIFKR